LAFNALFTFTLDEVVALVVVEVEVVVVREEEVAEELLLLIGEVDVVLSADATEDDVVSNVDGFD
jgi:hypothetical protein